MFQEERNKKERENQMNKTRFFKNEIEKIKDKNLQRVVKTYLEEYVPEYFWTEGASSSGRFHPPLSQGEGGLVRHTKAVCYFAEELLRVAPYCEMTEEEQDFVRVACIVHDTCKYGTSEYNKKEYKAHPTNAADWFADCWQNTLLDNVIPEILWYGIASHMGQWGECKPLSSAEMCVHLADYIASRPEIEIPSIKEDYVNALWNDEEVIFYNGSEESGE